MEAKETNAIEMERTPLVARFLEETMEENGKPWTPFVALTSHVYIMVTAQVVLAELDYRDNPGNHSNESYVSLAWRLAKAMDETGVNWRKYSMIRFT